ARQRRGPQPVGHVVGGAGLEMLELARELVADLARHPVLACVHGVRALAPVADLLLGDRARVLPRVLRGPAPRLTLGRRERGLRLVVYRRLVLPQPGEDLVSGHGILPSGRTPSRLCPRRAVDRRRSATPRPGIACPALRPRPTLVSPREERDARRPRLRGQ